MRMVRGAKSAWVDLKGLGGHIIDVLRISKSTLSHPHSYTKFRHIKKLGIITKAKSFVETGTHFGTTSRRAYSVFENVYTIEIDDELARRAKKKFKNKDKLEVIKGDAIIELEKVLSRDGLRSAVVFIDAHPCGPETSEGEVPEPVIHELEHISDNIEKVDGFIIDDFRHLGTKKGFPSKWEVLKKIEEMSKEKKELEIKVEADMIICCKNKYKNG